MRSLAGLIVLVLLAGGVYFAYTRIFCGKEAEKGSSSEGAAAERGPAPEPQTQSEPAPEPEPETPEPQTEPAQTETQQQPERENGEAPPQVRKSPEEDLIEIIESEPDDGVCAEKLLAALRKQKPADSVRSAAAAAGRLGAKREYLVWTLLSHAYRTSDDAEAREAWAEKMNPIVEKLFFSFREIPCCRHHTVEPGDYLSTLQDRFVVPHKLIMRMNGLKKTLLRVGQRIKIPVPPKAERMRASVQVDKSEHTLSVFINGLFVKRYRVSLGAEGRTPCGSFTIREKVHHPEWQGHPYGDPENIIGDWWLGLKGPVTGLGIHGTNDPDSIGKDVSKGCVRMLNDEVDELANTVPKGSPVVIRP